MLTYSTHFHVSLIVTYFCVVYNLYKLLLISWKWYLESDTSKTLLNRHEQTQNPTVFPRKYHLLQSWSLNFSLSDFYLTLQFFTCDRHFQNFFIGSSSWAQARQCWTLLFYLKVFFQYTTSCKNYYVNNKIEIKVL